MCSKRQGSISSKSFVRGPRGGLERCPERGPERGAGRAPGRGPKSTFHEKEGSTHQILSIGNGCAKPGEDTTREAQSRFRDAQTKPRETERSPDHSERPRKEQKGAERPGSSKAGSKCECVEFGTTHTNKAPNGLTLQLCTKK